MRTFFCDSQHFIIICGFNNKIPAYKRQLNRQNYTVRAFFAYGLHRHPAIGQQGSGVVALALRLLSITQHYRQRRGAGQGFDLRGAGAVEIRSHQKVFGRVAAQRQFRRQQHIRPAVAGAGGELQDAPGIAGKIADMGVDVASLSNLYPQGFLDVGTVDGELYGVPAKYNSKGTVWYRPDLFTAAGVEVPATWDEFVTVLDALKDNPGALGLGAADDWTLTDWFENIYVRCSDLDSDYDRVIVGYFDAMGLHVDDWDDGSRGGHVGLSAATGSSDP